MCSATLAEGKAAKAVAVSDRCMMYEVKRRSDRELQTLRKKMVLWRGSSGTEVLCILDDGRSSIQMIC